MLAGAQLGITVCSILLGRVGEPAVAHLLEKPFDLLGVPDAVLHTVSFVVAITIVVVLHVLLGEMVPKNIAIAGPESAAMLLVPPYLIWIRIARPFIAFYNWCAKLTLRAFGVEAKNELENTVSMIELSEMIAESLSEGLLDPEEHNRLTRALQIRNRIVADVAVPLDEIHAVPAAGDGAGPTVARHRAGARRDRLLPLPGRRRGRPLHRLPAHQGRAAAGRRSRRGASTRPWCGRCRGCSQSLPLPDALSRLRRDNSHLALVTAADDRVTAMVDARGPRRGSGGHRARRDPPCLSASSTLRAFSTRRSGPSGNGGTPSGWTRFVGPHQQRARARRGSPGVGLPVQLLQPAAAPAAPLAPRLRRRTRR